MLPRIIHRLDRTARRGATPGVRALCVLAFGLVSLLAGSVFAFSSGPLDGLTNAPGEGNCTQCHSTFPLNSGDGSLAMAGIGATYLPGQTYTLEVTLADPQAMRWGFEFTILNEAGDSVGQISPVDGTTQTSSAGNRDYAKHTLAGTFPGTPDSHTWQVQWIAPEFATGEVTLYVAGNAANNNGSTSGDRIYATSFVFGEENVVGVGDMPLASQLLPNYPNPFNPATTISFELPSDQAVRLTIYTVSGRRIRTLVDGQRSAGRSEVRWDGTDWAGRAVPSGTYLYQLQTGQTVATRRMVLVR